jgi:hypothetical protein
MRHAGVDETVGDFREQRRTETDAGHGQAQGDAALAIEPLRRGGGLRDRRLAAGDDATDGEDDVGHDETATPGSGHRRRAEQNSRDHHAPQAHR